MLKPSALPCLSLSVLALALQTDRVAADGDGHLLQYKFQTDRDIAYSVDSQSRILLQQGDAEQHVEHGSVTDRRFVVKSVDEEGNAILELQIDRVQLSASSDGGEPIKFDSASGESAPEMFQGVSKTVGKPNVRVTVSPRGEIQEIEWLTGGATAPNPTADEAAGLDILVVLPEGPIAIGESWKQKFDVDVSMTNGLRRKVTLQREYTLNNVQAGEATIALRTSVLSRLTDPAEESQLAGKTPQGTLVFDIAEGVVISRSLSVDKTIVGFNGANSKVRSIISWKETLTPARIAADDSLRR